jgi:hypothetical protein
MEWSLSRSSGDLVSYADRIVIRRNTDSPMKVRVSRLTAGYGLYVARMRRNRPLDMTG